MKNLKKYFKGFTLVELIIVITILAILATIAFVSFQSYTKDARDANRTATIKNIEKGLELFTIKTGNFPTPDEPTTFTGWLDGKVKISQGIVWDGVATIINMNTTPLDPNDKSKYTYSTFWDDNKYYQIAINAENRETSFIPQALAFTPKSAIVQWNYSFDPSLPSLIVVLSSIEWKTIFDPKVCFVIDWWQNSLSSSSWSCIEKQDMSLKEFDNNLVWYWDMETTFLSGEINYLKDLSGNGNDGWVFTNAFLTEKPIIGNGNIGIIWQAIKYYPSWTWGYIRLKNQASRFHNSYWITIIGFVKENDFSQWHRCIWKFHRNTATHWGWSLCFNQWNYGVHAWLSASWALESTYNLTGALNMDFSEWNMVTGVINYQNWILKYYQNWILIESKNINFWWKSYLYQDGDVANTIFDNIWYGSSPAPAILNWYLDELKIYNRALTDEEIKQQAKIAGF